MASLQDLGSSTKETKEAHHRTFGSTRNYTAHGRERVTREANDRIEPTVTA